MCLYVLIYIYIYIYIRERDLFTYLLVHAGAEESRDQSANSPGEPDAVARARVPGAGYRGEALVGRGRRWS